MSETEERVPNGASGDLLLAQVREAYGRAAYTHKIHEKQADLCFQKHRRQQRLLVGLMVISSGTFLVSLLGLVLNKDLAALVTSFIALLVTAMNLVSKTFIHGEDTQKHRDVAAKLWNVRESYLSLIVDLQSGVLSVEDGRVVRERLQEQALEVYSDAPRTTSKAYKAAQTALKDREDLTFSTQEIDLLLPVALRRSEGRVVRGDE